MQNKIFHRSCQRHIHYHWLAIYIIYIGFFHRYCLWNSWQDDIFSFDSFSFDRRFIVGGRLLLLRIFSFIIEFYLWFHCSLYYWLPHFSAALHNTSHHCYVIAFRGNFKYALCNTHGLLGLELLSSSSLYFIFSSNFIISINVLFRR